MILTERDLCTLNYCDADTVVLYLANGEQDLLISILLDLIEGTAGATPGEASLWVKSKIPRTRYNLVNIHLNLMVRLCSSKQAA